MNYSAEVWGFCKADKIETVHLQFCKRLLGVKHVHKMISFMGNWDGLPFKQKDI